MPRFKMIFLSEPRDAASEEEYNDWYQNRHLSELTRVEGVQNGQRFKLAVPMQGETLFQYMALYDIEAADASKVAMAIGASLEDGRIVVTDAIGRRAYGAIYEEFGSIVMKE